MKKLSFTGGLLVAATCLVTALTTYGADDSSRSAPAKSSRAESLAPIADGSDADGFTACPQSFIGRINGDYYYTCQRCDTCGQTTLHGGNEKTIDGNCTACQGSGCSDPFTGRRPPEGGAPIFGELSALANPVPAGSATRKGWSDDPRGRLELGPNVELVSEHVAAFTYEGKERTVRLFVLKVRSGGENGNAQSRGSMLFGIGQQTTSTRQVRPLKAQRIAGIGHVHRLLVPGIEVQFEVRTCGN